MRGGSVLRARCSGIAVCRTGSGGSGCRGPAGAPGAVAPVRAAGGGRGRAGIAIFRWPGPLGASGACRAVPPPKGGRSGRKLVPRGVSADAGFCAASASGGGPALVSAGRGMPTGAPGTTAAVSLRGACSTMGARGSGATGVLRTCPASGSAATPRAGGSAIAVADSWLSSDSRVWPFRSLAADAAGASEPVKRRRSSNATSSSIELECVFFSCTPNSGNRSRMTPGFTSNSRASSLILIFFIEETTG
jgi:hypothetical protein